MFIPLHDRNELAYIRLQYVTLSLIGFNTLIWIVTAANGADGNLTVAAVLGLGYIPAVANGYADLAPDVTLIPESATYLTYAFLHGNFLHLAGNMLFLWVFGDNVEDAMGHLRFLLFYCLCAIAGAAAHGLAHAHSQAPLIGASGAIAGVVAAYLVLHPRVRVWILAFGRVPLPLPAWLPLSLWIGFQAVMAVVDFDGDVSWAAHVGGIVAGAILVVLFRRRGVPLFDRDIVAPDAAVMKDERANPHRWGR
jgi:membrane associated rhomboid family serine protease